MKYLLIRQKHKRTKAIWETVGQKIPFETKVVDYRSPQSFRELIASLKHHDFDRVIFDCNIRSIGRDYKLLKDVRNLIIYDNDLYHHFHPTSAYFGMFIALFKTLMAHRIISTGLYTVQNFQKAGLNVSYLPKSYDPDYVHFLDIFKDIEVAFIGRTSNKIYRQRKKFLESLQKKLDVQIIRTSEDDDYNKTLNKIRFFISADQGLNEFMAKNFEALAAGCILCTVPTSEEEAGILGFEDMVNVVFYNSEQELISKIQYLKSNPDKADAIALAGRQLAETRHQDQHRAAEMEKIIAAPLFAPPVMRLRDRYDLFRLAAYHFVSRG
jgi:glycosyltransferase involved in cell wall biosynthesis